MNNGPISSYPFVRRIPDGDTHERHVCADCGWINYVNPKIVVGAVSTWEDKILLCKRAIEPRYGYWTVPAGFMEEGESTAEGAIRETMEEAGARSEIEALIGIYNIPRISQVHMMYRARMTSPKLRAGVESLEVKLVDWAEIPWEEIAFPSGVWALKNFYDTKNLSAFQPFDNPEMERHRRR